MVMGKSGGNSESEDTSTKLAGRPFFFASLTSSPTRSQSIYGNTTSVKVSSHLSSPSSLYTSNSQGVYLTKVFIAFFPPFIYTIKGVLVAPPLRLRCIHHHSVPHCGNCVPPHGIVRSKIKKLGQVIIANLPFSRYIIQYTVLSYLFLAIFVLCMQSSSAYPPIVVIWFHRTEFPVLPPHLTHQSADQIARCIVCLCP